MLTIQSLKNKILTFYDGFHYLVNPAFCVVCKVLDHQCSIALICKKCELAICPVVSTTIPLSKQYTLTVFAIAAYQEPLKSLILAKMYSDIAVSVQLGKLIWQKTNIKHMAPDVFVPIPLHWRRYAYRGYNQAQEMAQALSRESAIPYACLLQRHKSTAFQFGLSSLLRKANLTDAFVRTAGIDASLYYDKHIVLVDDLMTTGSTLKEAAQQLIPLKPKSISAVVVCRVI